MVHQEVYTIAHRFPQWLICPWKVHTRICAQIKAYQRACEVYHRAQKALRSAKFRAAVERKREERALMVAAIPDMIAALPRDLDTAESLLVKDLVAPRIVRSILCGAIYWQLHKHRPEDATVATVRALSLEGYKGADYRVAQAYLRALQEHLSTPWHLSTDGPSQ